MFAPWKVVQRLGTGTLTEAFLADGPNGQAVLKRLLPYYADHELLSASFILRGEEVRALDHPAIVRVLATGTVGRDRFVVMERAEGRALSRVFARLEQRGWSALPQIPVAACAYQAAKALAYAHSRGVFHHDVTLHNLYLSPSGHLRISDFGLAQTRRQYAPAEGHVELIPPEVAQGQKPDARVDIWQLAAATYQLLAGGLPPDALSKGFPPLSQRVEGADDTLSALLMKALSPIPSERPLAMAELVAGLGSWLERVGVQDAAAAAAPLYRNIFDDGPEEAGWSVPTVHPWPDESGRHKRVSAADESTPTSPKAPLMASGFSRRRALLWGAGAAALLGVGLFVYNAVLNIGAVEPPVTQPSPTPDKQAQAAPEEKRAVPGKKSLPLSASGVPAEFVVSPDRHGFYADDSEGEPLALAGLERPVLRASGTFQVPRLMQGTTEHLRDRWNDSSGVFVVLTYGWRERQIAFITDPFNVPGGVTELRAGFFSDRSNHRVLGDGQLNLWAINGPPASISLYDRPPFHLDDVERFTLSGLNAGDTYEMQVRGNPRDDGVVALFKAPVDGNEPARLNTVVGTAEGGGGQYLLKVGVYEFTGATEILFTMPRLSTREPISEIEVGLIEDVLSTRGLTVHVDHAAPGRVVERSDP